MPGRGEALAWFHSGVPTGVPDARRILQHLRRVGGDTRALCRFLGLDRRQLHRSCERLKIRLREERGARERE